MERAFCFVLWMFPFYPDGDTIIYSGTKYPMVSRIPSPEKPYAVASFNRLEVVK